MLEIITLFVSVWLLVKAIGLAFRLTWGAAKITASILMAVALPVLVVCLVFIGGFALMIPIILLAMAVGILRVCT